MNPTQLPTDGTLPLLVLQIIAVSGEFPAAFSGRCLLYTSDAADEL